MSSPTPASVTPLKLRASSLEASSIDSPILRPLPASLSTPPIVSPALSSARRVASSIPARNPIALRLYKVLGANYQDPSTLEALETLSSFYSSSPATESILDETHDHVMVDEPEAAAEDEGIIEWNVDRNARNDLRRHTNPNLKNIGTELAGNARKNLRRDLETKLAESSRRFLQAFAEVDQKLDALETHVQDMHRRCDEAEAKLQATNEGCKNLLERAAGLQSQRQVTAGHQSIVNLFLSRFTLTEAETESVVSRDVPVGQQVFATMDRVESIRNDCRVLLSGEEGETKAGLDIMSLTSSLMDQAYHKIARWCSFEFRQMGRDSQLEVGPIMREAVKRLRQRPELLNESLKVLIEVRQNTLLNSFIDALTRGGPGGLPRPIELHAHDPTRYVGDMLAWIHQAVAGEREYLESLFDVRGDGRMVGSVRVSKTTEEEGYITQLMDSDLVKLCTPLRVRVQQTIRSQEGSITSYKIANLLQFYLITIQQTIGSEAILSQTLKEITDVAYRVFFDTIDAQGRSLLRFLHPPEPDLAAPLALRDQIHVLREIMGVYESSLMGENDPAEREREFSQILEAAIDPAMEMCNKMCELKKDLTSWNRAIFLINCYVFVQNALQAYSFTGQYVEQLQKEVDKNVRILTTEHYEYLLHESGLEPIISAINTAAPDTPLSREPVASSQAVTAALGLFDTFLSQLDVVSSPRLLLLSVPRLSTMVHRKALHSVALEYGRVCDAVRKPENKYEFSGTLLGSRRPFGEMRVLWQVLGIDEENPDVTL
ncbi:Golgi transport complex subunit 6 [Tulasnella sp. 419]|nr:Golgi transport complex subunit 6 [Tulasnella sp. 419]